MMLRCYSELLQLPTFKERYEYLRLDGVVGEETFGFDRYLNQIFYNSQEWKDIRKLYFKDHDRDTGKSFGNAPSDVILDWMVTRFVERFLFII